MKNKAKTIHNGLNASVNLRKPNNGMIIKAMRDFKLNKKNCFMIGDKKSDLIAAKKSKIQFYKKNKVSLYDQIIKNLQNFQLISKKNF